MGDDRLRLVFTCCHPALALEARVALTLKVVSGLSTEAIGRAFLTSEATMGQRLLRAKQKIAHAGIPYRVPTDDFAERVDGVLVVVYLVFTEGYATGAALPRRRGDPARPAAGRADAGVRRDARPAGPDAAAARPPRRAGGRRRAGDARAPGPVAGGATTRSTRRWRCCAARGRCGARTPCRPTSPRCMRRRRRRTRPTGGDRGALRRAARHRADTGHRAQPRDRGRHERRRRSPGSPPSRPAADDPRLAGHYLVAAARGDLLSRAGLHDEALIAVEQAIELAPTEQERRQLEQRAAELRRS